MPSKYKEHDLISNFPFKRQYLFSIIYIKGHFSLPRSLGRRNSIQPCVDFLLLYHITKSAQTVSESINMRQTFFRFSFYTPPLHIVILCHFTAKINIYISKSIFFYRYGLIIQPYFLFQGICPQSPLHTVAVAS